MKTRRNDPGPSHITLALVIGLLLTLGACAGGSPEKAVPPPGPDPYGLNAALWLTASRCDPDNLEKLIQAGADVNYRMGPHRTTPLMEAMRSYDSKCPKRMAELLIQAGADLNAQDDRGYTALHYVAGGHCIPPQIEAVKYLVAHGADPTLRAYSSREAFARSRRRNKPTPKSPAAEGELPAEDQPVSQSEGARTKDRGFTPLELATHRQCRLIMGVLATYIERLREKEAQPRAKPQLPRLPLRGSPTDRLLTPQTGTDTGEPVSKPSPHRE